jgi:hypothetical protein
MPRLSIRISFPYPELEPLDVPEQCLLGIFSPSTVKAEKNEKEIVREAFSHPIESDPLIQMVEGCEGVSILVGDHTRTTPVRKILPRMGDGSSEPASMSMKKNRWPGITRRCNWIM